MRKSPRTDREQSKRICRAGNPEVAEQRTEPDDGRNSVAEQLGVQDGEPVEQGRSGESGETGTGGERVAMADHDLSE